jgi:catechol 2,3-dioxygenase-like lactoylglutathione lyase family enzyme
MNDLLILSVFAALPVHDLDAAVAWYARVLGRGDADARPAPHIAEFYLSADRDPGAGTLQLHVDPARAGGGLVTLNVADLEPIRSALDEVGIGLPTQTLPIDAPGIASVTVGTVTDPDGNSITVVEPTPRTPGSPLQS